MPLTPIHLLTTLSPSLDDMENFPDYNCTPFCPCMNLFGSGATVEVPSNSYHLPRNTPARSLLPPPLTAENEKDPSMTTGEGKEKKDEEAPKKTDAECRWRLSSSRKRVGDSCMIGGICNGC